MLDRRVLVGGAAEDASWRLAAEGVSEPELLSDLVEVSQCSVVDCSGVALEGLLFYDLAGTRGFSKEEDGRGGRPDRGNESTS